MPCAFGADERLVAKAGAVAEIAVGGRIDLIDVPAAGRVGARAHGQQDASASRKSAGRGIDVQTENGEEPRAGIGIPVAFGIGRERTEGHRRCPADRRRQTEELVERYGRRQCTPSLRADADDGVDALDDVDIAHAQRLVRRFEAELRVCVEAAAGGAVVEVVETIEAERAGSILDGADRRPRHVLRGHMGGRLAARDLRLHSPRPGAELVNRRRSRIGLAALGDAGRRCHSADLHEPAEGFGTDIRLRLGDRAKRDEQRRQDRCCDEHVYTRLPSGWIHVRPPIGTSSMAAAATAPGKLYCFPAGLSLFLNTCANTVWSGSHSRAGMYRFSLWGPWCMSPTVPHRDLRAMLGRSLKGHCPVWRECTLSYSARAASSRAHLRRKR